MARPLPNHPLTAGASHLCLAIGSVFFCALTLFMCASHSRKWVHSLKACYSYSYEEPVIQLNNRGNGFKNDTEDEEEEESVWQKNILMGGKCQLPDFSGVIIYDSQGNIAPPTKPRLLALTN